MFKQDGRGRRALVVLIAAIIGTGTIGAAPQQGSADDSDETCWYNADTELMQCFEDEDAFESAVEDQTGGVLLYAGDPPPAARGDVTIQATYVLATLYANSDMLGANINVTTSISTMCSTHHFTWNVMPSTWNDRVSAFYSYGTCKVQVYEHTYRTGATYGPRAVSTTLGVMNDATSSVWVTG